MPHNNAASLYIDENGLAWVGTVEGLARIDSLSSKIFTTHTYPEILSNNISDLSGCEGKVFAASAMGVSAISASGSKVEKLLERQGIVDIEALSDCTLFAADKTEIAVIKGNKINMLNAVNGLPEGRISLLFSDRTLLYVGYEDGSLYSYDGVRFSAPLCPEIKSALTAGTAKDGRSVVGTADGKIYELKDGKCVLAADSGTGEKVTSVDLSGETAVFVSGGELWFADGGKTEACGPFCRSTGTAAKVLLDGRALWLSGSRGAARYYRGKFITLGRESGLMSEKVYALLEDGSGRVWIGTRGGGLFVYSEGKIEQIQDVNGNIGRFVGGMASGREGDLLVGTPDGIVSLMPGEPQKMEKMKTANNSETGAVSAIFRDKKGRSWAGGAGGTIYMFTQNGWQLIRKTGDLQDDFVSAISEDKSGNVWFATSKGLLKLDANDEFHKINQGLGDNTVVSLFVDSDGIVFAGTMNRGISLLMPDSKIAGLDSRRGLCSDTIFGIVPDDDGNIWFASTNGIFSLPRRAVIDAADSGGTLECTAFDSSDGIRRPESTGGVQPSVLKRRNGDLWFPTLEGIAVLEKGAQESDKFAAAAPSADAEKGGGLKVVLILLGAAAVCVFAGIFVKNRRKKAGDPERNGAAENPEAAEKNNEDQDAEAKAAFTGESEALTAEDTEIIEENIEASGCDDISDFGEPLAEEKQKYEKSRLDDDIAESYANELRTLMQDKKPYKDPDLTLPDLAKKLKLTTNVLSQVLNGCCGQNFYTFVNTYRVEEVIEMMKLPENGERSILELAYDAGFKSKTTFNSIFKKYTGKTPSEFRKDLKQ